MRFRKTTTALLGLALVPTLAAAQEPTHITFDQAVAIALRQSTAMERAANAVALDELTVTQARMSLLPDLRLSTSAGNDFGRSFSQTEGRVLTSSNQSVSARVSSSVTVFDGLANVNSLKGAQLTREAGVLDMQRTSQQTVFSVISGYLSLIAAREQVQVQQENLSAQQQQEHDVQVRVDGGTRPISDLYQQQANVAAARSALVNARGQLELARVDLIQALRLDPTGEYVFEAPALPDTISDRATPEAQALLSRALEQRPDLQAYETRVDAAEKSVDAAKGARWPSLAVSGSYGSAYTSASDFGLIDQFDQRRGGSVGVSLSLPIFDRLGTSTAVQRARLQADNARLSLADERQQVALEVKRAVVDHASALERLDAADARAEAARRALDATQRRYEAGVATLLEVTQSRSEVVAAESERVNARYNLLFQERLLDYYTGDLDPSSRLDPAAGS